MPTILRGIVLISLLIVSGGGAAAQAMPSGGSDNMLALLLPFLVLTGVALLECFHCLLVHLIDRRSDPPDAVSRRDKPLIAGNVTGAQLRHAAMTSRDLSGPRR